MTDRTLDEITADIQELLGVTDDEAGRACHLNICNAQETASTCAECARAETG